MSNQTSDNNKRIVKNTLLLYFRMLFVMVVSLFMGDVYSKDVEIIVDIMSDDQYNGKVTRHMRRLP